MRHFSLIASWRQLAVSGSRIDVRKTPRLNGRVSFPSRYSRSLGVGTNAELSRALVLRVPKFTLVQTLASQTCIAHVGRTTSARH
jgi:hypothetical protein